MVMDVNYTYHGDHFTIYTNVKSFCCTPETNIMLYVNIYTSIKKILEVIQGYVYNDVASLFPNLI